MKKMVILLSLLMFVALIQPCEAGTFFDDFNDGNTDGWISAKACKWCVYGNWRLSDGVIVEDFGRDHYMFLSDSYSVSSQSVEADILNHDTGSPGITIWYQDYNNWVQVFYPYVGEFGILEKIDGSSVFTTIPYQSNTGPWRTLSINADSLTGELAINLDDEYVTTYSVTTTNRTGLSGFNSSNAGGSFDNFRLTSDDITVIPEPISSTLFIVGGATLAFRRFRKKK